jgi:hypothetical protein
MQASGKQETTYEDGYREGWASIANDLPVPRDPRPPPPVRVATYAAGFAYGRLDALERLRPVVEDSRG